MSLPERIDWQAWRSVERPGPDFTDRVLLGIATSSKERRPPRRLTFSSRRPAALLAAAAVATT